MGGNLRDSGRIVNSQMGSSTLQDTQYNIKHAGIQGYENTRMENEKNRGNRIQDRGDPSQPGGPSKEGPADFQKLGVVSNRRRSAIFLFQMVPKQYFLGN